MRWWFAGLGLLLAIWLASGDPHGQAKGAGAGTEASVPWDEVAAPSAPSVEFGAFYPGTFGAHIDLGTACLSGAAAPGDGQVTLHYLLAGVEHIAVHRIGCPVRPVFVIQPLDLVPGQKATVRNAYLELGDQSGQRVPAQGFAPEVTVEGPAPAWPSLPMAGANVGLVAALWGWATWTDPTRARLTAPWSRR